MIQLFHKIMKNDLSGKALIKLLKSLVEYIFEQVYITKSVLVINSLKYHGA